MTSIASASSACLKSFASLSTSLERGQPEHRESMPQKVIENETGRFRIWMGNLGAMQKGRSSLDFRLRESIVMRGNVLKLLNQLGDALRKSIEVVDGLRLPWEQQLILGTDSDSSDYSSDSNDDRVGWSSDPVQRTELALHLRTISAAIADLYKLSFKIRAPSTRASQLKAILYKDIDPETDVDLFSVYAIFDRLHVKESLRNMRIEHLPSQAEAQVDYEFLTERLSKAVTNRRRYFRYWRKHARKLANFDEDSKPIEKKRMIAPSNNPKEDTVDEETQTIALKSALSAAGQTFLSATEATKYDTRLDDQLETASNISYATTAYDPHGNIVDLPPPPSLSPFQKEFTCLYCCVVCPSRHAQGKSWRAHILQDLQPYICTYPSCPEPDQLYMSRYAWLEHERLLHRKVWQCFEHANTFFSSKDGLRNHLKSSHESLTKHQILNIVDLSETTLEDERQLCPFCFMEGSFEKGLGYHMAFHQELFSVFSMPKELWKDGDVSVQGSHSSQAQGVLSEDLLGSVSLGFVSPVGSQHGASLDWNEDSAGNAADEQHEHPSNSLPSNLPISALFAQAALNLDPILDILPNSRKRTGPGWHALFNPEIDRELDVELVRTIPYASSDPVVRLSHDGLHLAACGWQSPANIYNLITGERVATLQHGDGNRVYSLCFSHDGKYLVTAAHDSLVRVWDVASWTIKYTLAGHEGAVNSVDIAQNGKLIASGSEDNTVRIWSFPSTTLKYKFDMDHIRSVAISPDSSSVAVAARGGAVRIGGISTSNGVRRQETHTDRSEVTSVAFAPDNSEDLLTWNWGGTATIWPARGRFGSPRTFKCTIFGQVAMFAFAPCFTPDTRWVVTWCMGQNVQFWDSVTGERQMILVSDDSVASFSCSHSQNLFATGSDNTVRIWRTGGMVQPEPLLKLAHHLVLKNEVETPMQLL
ncbi:hypothetical protein AJ80_06356 [Polytolypa hystricis UAMH7299]|uniref:Uncharacterized protein n=1 Tax=Polytolypa hystricis (strain UAMH7299) TaxID=1447883 RepID=A0A2B7XXL9_POLH7|nr:hypothetical protein AJ80_06356 [Polytolypa hystricis UAMH7299]